MDLYSAVQVLFDFESFLHDQDQARDAGAGQASVPSGPPPPVLREAVDTFCGAVLSAADNDAACGAIREAVCARAERLLPRLLGPDEGKAGNVGGPEGHSWESELAFANGLMILSIALSGVLSHPGCCSMAPEPEAQGPGLPVHESCAAALSRLLHILLDVWPLLIAIAGSRPVAATAFMHEMIFRFLRTVVLDQAPTTIRGHVLPFFQLTLSLRIQVFGGLASACFAFRPGRCQLLSSSEDLTRTGLGLPWELARCLIAVTEAAAATTNDVSLDDAEVVGGLRIRENYLELQKNFASLALLGLIDLRAAFKRPFESFCTFLAQCPSYNNLDLVLLLEGPRVKHGPSRCVSGAQVSKLVRETLGIETEPTLFAAYQLFADAPSLVVRLDPLQQARLISSLLGKIGIANDLEGFEIADPALMAKYVDTLMAVLAFGCLGPMWLVSARPQLIESLVGYAAKLVRGEKEAPSDTHSDLVSSLLNFFSADPKARHYLLRDLLRSGLLPEVRLLLEAKPPWESPLVTNKVLRSIFPVAVGLCGIKKECVYHIILEHSLTCLANALREHVVTLNDTFQEPRPNGDPRPDSLHMCCKIGAKFFGIAGECKLWGGRYVLRPSIDAALLATGLRRATDILPEAIRPSGPAPACPLGVVLPWVQILLAVHRILCEGMASVLGEARKSRQAGAAEGGKFGGKPKPKPLKLKPVADLRQQFIRLSQCRREVSSLLRRMSREVLPEAERREAGRWEGVEEGEVAAALSLTG